MRKESYTFAEYNQEREAVIKESQYKEKYKNALKEIREIAEENDESLQGYQKEWANNKLILEKINEVLNA